jgi:hypothetical protein
MSSQGARRHRRNLSPRTESLEDKTLLSAGMGSTFAIDPGIITKAGGSSTIKFTINPSDFTAPKGGKIVLGIDVAANSGSSVKPAIVSVTSNNGRGVRVQHGHYSKALVKSNKLPNSNTSAVLATVQVPRSGQKPITYTLHVKGLSRTSGQYLAGFYLPGDVNGDGVVDKTDIETITKDLGSNSTSSTYSFDADSNRDGKITIQDMKPALSNVGATVTISPIVQVNLDPASDSGLQDRITNIRTVTLTGTTSPNAKITFVEASGKAPAIATTADASGHFSVQETLGDGSNTFAVTSTDSFGQVISGNIAPITYSTTAPTSSSSTT